MIIPARSHHLPAINNIYNQAVADSFRTAHTNPVSPDERKQWFADHSPSTYPVFVYLDDETVLGWLSISSYSKNRQALADVVEVSYYIDYNHHNQGIASALMEHSLQFCREYGYRIAVAILVSDNKPSIALLEKFGFSEAGRIPDGLNFDGEFRDHLYMYKKL
ncbi:N-acetyltransferase [Aliifodinibius salipaludis]|uniref:N-acetyltransferase n=1 Tax=Fodinibius salipaludis TaxID=2032627 RepID=A0A2A2GEW4_9BACT|nr:GNAT family N-acetyltransferase [Aliifodinibius salipaludis]PAU95740.1 N-acetyltransferase [Aliifodinibius salipaludis]